MQGCDYRCPWCHSPHTRGQSSGLLFSEAMCSSCRRCEKICTRRAHTFSGSAHNIRRSECTGCGLCVTECPQSIEGASSAALRIVPRSASIQDIYHLISPQLAYCGALTISGGEPLLQWKAVQALLSLCKSIGVETAVETTLTTDEQVVADLRDFVDLWLVGLRPLYGHNLHPNVPDPSITEHNLQLLQKENVCVRYPVMPGYTDGMASLARTADIMAQTNISKIELLPPNVNVGHYYREMGKDFILENHSANVTLDEAVQYFRGRGFQVTLIH